MSTFAVHFLSCRKRLAGAEAEFLVLSQGRQAAEMPVSPLSTARTPYRTKKVNATQKSTALGIALKRGIFFISGTQPYLFPYIFE